MRSGEQGLDLRTVHHIRRIVHIQEASEIRPRNVACRYGDGLVIDAAVSVFGVVRIRQIRAVAGGKERHGMAVWRRLRPVRPAAIEMAKVRGIRVETGVCSLGGPHAEEGLYILRLARRSCSTAQANPSDRKVVIVKNLEREGIDGEPGNRRIARE